MKHLLPLILIVSSTAAQHARVEQTKRVPLQKKQVVLKSPDIYLQRALRVDPKTGAEILYDPKPRGELLDAKAGKYSREATTAPRTRMDKQ